MKIFFKKTFQRKLKKLEEVLIKFLSENGLKFLETEIPDEWTYLFKELAYTYQYFNSPDEYQNPDNFVKKRLL